LTIENVKLPALVEAIHDRLLSRIEEKRQSFTIAIEPTLPELRGDADELERAFLNLIENAINYTPYGGRIAVRALLEGRMVHVEVQDTGIGIAPKDQVLVFERFFRTSAGKQTHQNGTGLGLAIVKRIVEMHGGKIELESTPGEGSVFHLYLPMVSSADDETQPSLTPPHSLPLLDAHADG
jgi:two-component system phosphate regulon sensor histidine kinase PhoR